MEVSSFNQCLFCQSILESDEELATFGRKKSPLSTNLEVIFVLRKMLQVPVSLISQFLQTFTAFPMENWIRTCDTCQGMISECWTIHEQICGLHRRWEKCQRKIVSTIRQGEGIKVNKKQDNRCKIYKHVWQFVHKFEYPATLTTNPSVDGDLRAKRLANLKLEPDDEFSMEPTFHVDYDAPRKRETPPESPPTIRKSERSKTNAENSVSNDFTEDAMAESSPQTSYDGGGDDEWTGGDAEPDGKQSPDASDYCHSSGDEEEKPTNKPKLSKTKSKPRKSHHGSRAFKPFPEDEVQIVCPVKNCFSTFLDSRDLHHLETHKMESHTEEEVLEVPPTAKVYQCILNKCQMIFGTRQSMRQHRAIHQKSTTRLAATPVSVKCIVDNCGTIWGSFRAAYQHQNEQHPNIPSDTPFLECGHCGTQYQSRGALKSHWEVRHCPEKRVVCNICGVQQYSIYRLRYHQKTSSRCLRLQGLTDEETSVICDLCGQRFSNKHSLTSHRRSIHEQLRPFQCDNCGKGFRLKSLLEAHLANTHQIGDWKCEETGEGDNVCGRVFATEKKLKWHINYIHKRTGGYACEEPGCGRRYPTKWTLQCHLNQSHVEGAVPKYICKECGKGFHFMHYMVQHNRSVHSGKKDKRKRIRRRKGHQEAVVVKSETMD